MSTVEFEDVDKSMDTEEISTSDEDEGNVCTPQHKSGRFFKKVAELNTEEAKNGMKNYCTECRRCWNLLKQRKKPCDPGEHELHWKYVPVYQSAERALGQHNIRRAFYDLPRLKGRDAERFKQRHEDMTDRLLDQGRVRMSTEYYDLWPEKLEKLKQKVKGRENKFNGIEDDED